MDTIFGRGHHQRIRVRPGKVPEAYTVGGGVHPLKPSGFVNRYDLEKAQLTERLDPIAGTVGEDARPDTGAGAVQDVAFSPDGSRIYVVAPTRNGENTLFRAGKITAKGVSWGELVTICDAQLVTLATTKADPKHVYAAGRGKGVYRIAPDAVDPSMAPEWGFAASGHLVLTGDGRGYATAAAPGGGSEAGRYESVVRFRVKESGVATVALPEAGEDDLAVVEAKTAAGTRVYAVVGTGSDKSLAVFDGEGRPVGATAGAPAIALPSSAIGLAPFAPTGVLLVVSEDDCVVAIFDVAKNVLADEATVPVQAGPAAVASDAPRGFAYVLNHWSDTITVIPAGMLATTSRFPWGALAAYRRGILLAFRDLTAGFLQYLKDCFCDRLLIDCPECDGDERIYLASISIRKGGVYKVCNFSRRKYVKSFPTVGYWASVVPVLPFAKKLVEAFCCTVLPDIFRRYQPQEVDTTTRPSAKVRYSTARSSLTNVQESDLPWKLQQLRQKAGIGAALAGKSVLGGLTRARAAQPAPATKFVGQPVEDVQRVLADQGAEVVSVPELPGLGQLLGNFAGFLRTPGPGDRVTLHEAGGRVAYYSVTPEGADVQEHVRTLSQALRAKDADVTSLREEVQALRSAQDQLLAAVSSERVAAMAAEIEELRRFREEATTRLGRIESPRRSGKKPAGPSDG
jgi:DNA-binding beta-propeller fold protein YncE